MIIVRKNDCMGRDASPSEDFALMQNGNVICASGSKLLLLDKDASMWKELMDLASLGIQHMQRIAIEGQKFWWLMRSNNYFYQNSDQTGRTIALLHKPKRIVSTVPSITELLCDIGLDEQLVGRTKFCDSPQELVQKIPALRRH